MGAVSLAVAVLTLPADGQQGASSSAADAERDRVHCRRKLLQLHDALEEYRKDRETLPSKLSELRGSYLKDPDLFFCPVAQREGRTSGETTGHTRYGQNDPGTSYSFEFSVDPLNKEYHGKAWTMRDWKSRQMEVVGSRVPLVRCHEHGRCHHLNLSYAGKVYPSSLQWESETAHFLNADMVTEEIVFAPNWRPKVTGGGVGIPARGTDADRTNLDLSSVYNAVLNAEWGSRPDDTERTLGTGVVEFAGRMFDVRGAAHLADGLRLAEQFPTKLKIPLGKSCRRAHLLHGGCFRSEFGDAVSRYRIRTADGSAPELAIVYGRHVLHWAQDPGKPERFEPRNTAAVDAGKHKGDTIRLFVTTWTNPRPDVAVDSIEFLSATKHTAPFLLAITIDP